MSGKPPAGVEGDDDDGSLDHERHISSVTTFVPSTSSVIARRRSNEPRRDSTAAGNVDFLKDGERAKELPLSRREVAVAILKDWDGRDRLMQLLHALILSLHHSLTVSPLFPLPRLLLTLLLRPSTRSLALRRLYLLGEGVSNARKMAVVLQWLTHYFALAMQRLRVRPPRQGVAERLGLETHAEAEKERAAEKQHEIEKAEGEHVLQEQERIVEKKAHHTGYFAWRRLWEHRVGVVADSLGDLADACDLVAFLDGAGLAWSLGGRQRKGLERIAVILSLCSQLTQHTLLRLRATRVRLQVRDAYRALMEASDAVLWATPAEVTARQIGSGDDDEEALTDDYDGCGPPGRHLSAGVHPIHSGGPSTGSATPLSREQQSSSSSSARQAAETRLFLTDLLLERTRRTSHRLTWTRRSLQADLAFTLYEALFPKRDKQGAEGLSGVLSALWALGSCASRLRWDEEDEEDVDDEGYVH